MAYSTRSDIEDVFGVDEVSKWADLDNDANATKITNRIARAIEVADEKVDAALRGGAIAVPVPGSSVLITNIAAILAGVWLYDARGVVDFDPETGKAQHRLHFQRAGAMRKLKLIRTGDLDIGVAQVDLTPHVGAS